MRQVTHGADDFEAGDSVILTLKDQGILEEDEHGQAKGLADHEDELENVNMKEAEVRRGRAMCAMCQGRHGPNSSSLGNRSVERS